MKINVHSRITNLKLLHLETLGYYFVTSFHVKLLIATETNQMRVD